MQNKGWVKLHRQINENVFLTKDNNAYLVFVKLLTIASSKGEWAGGRRQLAEITNLNNRTLYDVLQRLKTQQLINIKSNRKYSTITICNWRKYQAHLNHTSNHYPTTSQPQPNTLIRIKNKELESDTANQLPVAQDNPSYLKAKAMAEKIKLNAESPRI